MKTSVPHSRRIGDIVAQIPEYARAVVHGDTEVLVTGISQDSRLVQRGDLFCCIRGEKFDGHAYAKDAVSRGAVAIITEEVLIDLPDSVVQVTVATVRDVIGICASEIYDNPSHVLKIIGVTGTNGKTSTVSIIGDLLSSLGAQITTFGTLTGERTTPEAIDLQKALAECVAQDITHVVMEVSSHALDLGRVKGTSFAAVVFTNLGNDHLDFHGSQENYFAAKKKLFHSEYSSLAIINRDDRHGVKILESTDLRSVSYGCEDAQDVVVMANSTNFEWKNETIRVRIGGAFTVFNVLAAVTVVESLGYSPSEIAMACEDVRPVRGRFELVPGVKDFHVVVDYAHTPEGLREVLKTARALTRNDLSVVFGCGGDRDRSKRPLMGQIAGALADSVYITSDNPRSENPQTIIDEIFTGVSQPRGSVITIVDRREAISVALHHAKSGDVVVIAGKGHETTQEIDGTTMPFDDVVAAAEVIREIQEVVS
jgi:UDP-N-acetylmuramoyl-L-alanyl-D-glutamate--2,6-diaminopimelate ligase